MTGTTLLVRGLSRSRSTVVHSTATGWISFLGCGRGREGGCSAGARAARGCGGGVVDLGRDAHEEFVLGVVTAQDDLHQRGFLAVHDLGEAGVQDNKGDLGGADAGVVAAAAEQAQTPTAGVGPFGEVPDGVADDGHEPPQEVGGHDPPDAAGLGNRPAGLGVDDLENDVGRVGPVQPWVVLVGHGGGEDTDVGGDVGERTRLGVGVRLSEQRPLVGVKRFAGVQEQSQPRQDEAACAQVRGKADERRGPFRCPLVQTAVVGRVPTGEARQLGPAGARPGRSPAQRVSRLS